MWSEWEDLGTLLYSGRQSFYVETKVLACTGKIVADALVADSNSPIDTD